MHRPRTVTAVFAAAFALVVAASSARAADKVSLEGGAVAEGVVVRESADEVVLRQDNREVRFPRKLVKAIERDPALAVADGVLAGRLGGEVPADRVAAGEEIIRTWPASRATLDMALFHPRLDVRIEATHLLARTELGDTRERILQRVADPDGVVRCVAIRALRTRRILDVEPRLIEITSFDPDAGARTEAIRSLEDLGTTACLPALVEQLSRETTATGKRRLCRVLRKITGEDAGDDVEKWRLAVERAKHRATRPPTAATAAAPEGAPPAVPASVPGTVPADAPPSVRPLSADATPAAPTAEPAVPAAPADAPVVPGPAPDPAPAAK